LFVKEAILSLSGVCGKQAGSSASYCEPLSSDSL